MTDPRCLFELLFKERKLCPCVFCHWGLGFAHLFLGRRLWLRSSLCFALSRLFGRCLSFCFCLGLSRALVRRALVQVSLAFAGRQQTLGMRVDGSVRPFQGSLKRTIRNICKLGSGTLQIETFLRCWELALLTLRLMKTDLQMTAPVAANSGFYRTSWSPSIWLQFPNNTTRFPSQQSFIAFACPAAPASCLVRGNNGPRAKLVLQKRVAGLVGVGAESAPLSKALRISYGLILIALRGPS